jgi:mannose-1-phosphate guanylyltransferase
VLGLLARDVSSLGCARKAANASRCPDLVEAELRGVTGSSWEILFEPRPLGTVGTLARLAAAGAKGTWLVCNTDMVTDLGFGEMIRWHFGRGSDWTVAIGDFPEGGGYGPLGVGEGGCFGSAGGIARHFQGVAILGPGVLGLAASLRTGSLFGDLAGAALSDGLALRAWESGAEWFDTGTPGTYRKALLSRGSFVHPTAVVEDGARLSGSWFVSAGCRMAAGAELRDSVMLEGSTLVSGCLVEDVLPWFCERRLQAGNA